VQVSQSNAKCLIPESFPVGSRWRYSYNPDFQIGEWDEQLPSLDGQECEVVCYGYAEENLGAAYFDSDCSIEVKFSNGHQANVYVDELNELEVVHA